MGAGEGERMTYEQADIVIGLLIALVVAVCIHVGWHLFPFGNWRR